jgi:hypothetical protein
MGLSEGDFNKLLEVLRKRYPHWIARKDAKEASGGVLSIGTFANRDSLGTGVEGAFKLYGKTCYPTDNFIEFLRKGFKGGDA